MFKILKNLQIAQKCSKMFKLLKMFKKFSKMFKMLIYGIKKTWKTPSKSIVNKPYFSKKSRRQKRSESTDEDQTDRQIEQIKHDKATDRHTDRHKTRYKTKTKLVTNKATSVSELFDTEFHKQTGRQTNKHDHSVTDSELVHKSSRHVAFTAKSDSELQSNTALNKEPIKISLNLNHCGCSLNKCGCSKNIDVKLKTCNRGSFVDQYEMSTDDTLGVDHVTSRKRHVSLTGCRSRFSSQSGRLTLRAGSQSARTKRLSCDNARADISTGRRCGICNVEISATTEKSWVCIPCSRSFAEFRDQNTLTTLNIQTETPAQTDRQTDRQITAAHSKPSHFRTPSWCSTLIRCLFALLFLYLLLYTLFLWLSDSGQCPGRSWRWWRQLSPAISFRTYQPQPH